ncbi:MAG: hypothetical protein MUF42_05380 [Cytophagaceae bacterium]|jgi:hypothetical protein|nr:hypothetical protein [Cytophagaceae bacterium]
MENKANKRITFEVTLDEANLIFKSLGKQPFETVYELIGKLNEQANDQLRKPSSEDTIKSLFQANQ